MLSFDCVAESLWTRRLVQAAAWAATKGRRGERERRNLTVFLLPARRWSRTGLLFVMAAIRSFTTDPVGIQESRARVGFQKVSESPDISVGNRDPSPTDLGSRECYTHDPTDDDICDQQA